MTLDFAPAAKLATLGWRAECKSALLKSRWSYISGGRALTAQTQCSKGAIPCTDCGTSVQRSALSLILMLLTYHPALARMVWSISRAPLFQQIFDTARHWPTLRSCKNCIARETWRNDPATTELLMLVALTN